MENCTNHNGTYACKKARGHNGYHACHVWGGKATWADTFAPVHIRRMPL